MKRYLKFIFSGIMAILLISTCFQNIQAEEMYQRIETIKEPVTVNKEFTIKFTEELDPETISNRYIQIYNTDKNETPVSVYVELDPDDKKVVRVRPSNRFTQGKKYKLVIPAGVRAKNGEPLGKGYVYYFTVKNFYEGLPVEGGIIIIGNEAYALDYIAKNSSKKNEILKGNYKVFYIDETMKNEIKDIIGGDFVDGTNLPPGYNFREPLYYTDADGVRTTYMWNSVHEEFRKLTPRINMFVTVNQQTPFKKVLMYKVKQIIGVDGAKYFRMNSSNEYYKINEPYIFSSSELNDTITLYSASMTKLAEADVYNLVEGSVWKDLKVFEPTAEGNSAGNIINNGYVAADENGYIIYNNTGDGGKLYINDTNGMYHAVISDDFAQYINVSDEWIYYSNYDDKGKLYKMRIDGSEKTKLTDDRTVFISVLGDYIYYTNYSQSGKIYRVKKDGSDVVVDEAGEKHGNRLSTNYDDEAYFLNIVGEWLYYSNVSDHYRVYAVNKAGNMRIRLSDEGASSIQVVDDWIYYTNNKGKLKKVKKDGSKETEELDGVVAKFKRGYFFNVVNDWIYYSNAEDSNRLYKIKTDGSENMRLTKESVTYISVAYNTIYFVSNDKLYTVPVETVGKTRPKLVEKVEIDKKVVQVDDVKVSVPHDEVNKTMEWLEEKYLPSKVPGIMSDNRMKELVVQWDKKNVTVSNGVRKYKGKLIGYNQYIYLDMRIPSEMLNSTTTIAVYNNPGQNSGYIEIYSDPVYDDEANFPPKLGVGDRITIYEDERLTLPIRSATVTRVADKNKAIFRNFKMDRYGGTRYYISITRKGKAPSKGTMFTVASAPVITNSIHKPVVDKDFEGLGIDGRDFYVPEFSLTRNKPINSSKMYLTKNGGKLEAQDRNIVPFDQKELTGTTWIGRRYQDDGVPENQKVPMNIDSYGRELNSKLYSLYILSSYIETAAPDMAGSAPLIRGWVVSEPVSIDVISEGLPKDPGITTETKKYGETIKLKTTPKPGETAYLVPVWKSYYENPEYNQYIKGTWLEGASEWLDKASEWLMENETTDPWLFTDESLAIQNSHVTKLEGDGSTSIMRVPTGFIYSPGDDSVKINSRYYAPNVEYKLVIINEIGVSSVSNGTLTVDNRPPIIVEEFLEGDAKYVESGEPITFQSKYENATVYISYKLDNLDTVEQLEEAVGIGAAYKFSLISGVTTLLPSDAIKPDQVRDNMNYKISVVDEVGNKRHVGNISVYVDTTELKQIIKDAFAASSSGEVLAGDLVRLESKRQEAQAIMDKINSPYRKDVVNQSEIDRMVQNFRMLLIELGIPYKPAADADPVEESYNRLTMVKNFLKKVRLLSNKTQAADLNAVDNNLWLPNKFGYEGSYEYSIEWKAEENKVTSSHIQTSGNLAGVISQPVGYNPVDVKNIVLTATIKDSKGTALGVVEHAITILAKRFDTIVTVPLSNRARIVSKGVTINSESDITVKVFDPVANAYRPMVVYDGITYNFTKERNVNGVDWDIIWTSNPGDTDGGANAGTVLNMQIEIQGVIMNQQIKLWIPENGLEAVFMKY